MKNKAVLCGIISLVLIGIFMAGCGENYDKTVQLVRNGNLKMNPDVPIGKAFDKFFANGKWKSFISTENQTVVEFNGDCTFDGSPAKTKVQFIVDGNSFNLEYVDINGVALNLFESAAVIEKVLSEYNK